MEAQNVAVCVIANKIQQQQKKGIKRRNQQNKSNKSNQINQIKSNQSNHLSLLDMRPCLLLQRRA